MATLKQEALQKAPEVDILLPSHCDLQGPCSTEMCPVRAVNTLVNYALLVFTKLVTAGEKLYFKK